jgi:hypothetical protein
MAREVDELLRTPEETTRKCTDVGWLIVFAAILGGLGFCIYRSVEAGDIQRLQSLPDYQGTQCTWLSKVAFFLLNTLWYKFVFAPLLHHKKSDDFQAFNFFLIQDP